MQIFKFGGTSLGTAETIRYVMDIIRTDQPKIVVLSANGKTTDAFSSLIDYLFRKQFEQAIEIRDQLVAGYFELIDRLFTRKSAKEEAEKIIHQVFDQIGNLFETGLSPEDAHWLISRGEVISTHLFSLLLKENRIDHALIPASTIIQKKPDGQVDLEKLKDRLSLILKKNTHTKCFITEGFICSDAHGESDTLGRGGSDFTASLLGRACGASVIQIWSDVDGFLNNDPGYIKDSSPLQNLSYDEAEELAYFGARILHPACIFPAKKAEIPILLKNTLNPDARGTLISGKIQQGSIKAVAARDGISSITIHSGRMFMAYGFLRKLFEVFEKYRTPVDMVTTSEVSVSVTLDDISNLDPILSDLGSLGELECHHNQSIICVVGDQLAKHQGNVARIFSMLEHVPIRMISYGAARNSISVLVDTAFKTEALEALNGLFYLKEERLMTDV